MTEDNKYKFHQTPIELCKDIITSIQWIDNINVLEPFAGDGGFYNNLPNTINKFKTEIEEGRDFRAFDYNNVKINTIISNPPFKLINENGKEHNAFFEILMYYASKQEIDNIYFLVNDYCYNSLTPKRLKKMNNEYLYINKITTCDIKKWRGRYYLIHFNRQKNISFEYFESKY